MNAANMRYQSDIDEAKAQRRRDYKEMEERYQKAIDDAKRRRSQEMAPGAVAYQKKMAPARAEYRRAVSEAKNRLAAAKATAMEER
jgi:hypothetical protein